MVVRVGGGISTQLNPSGLQQSSSKEASGSPEIGKQVQQTLFGKPKPTILDLALFPRLVEQMKLLNKYRKKLAVMVGDEEEDYEIVLADGTIAMIDEHGTIFVGAGFLKAFAETPEVLVGVLAHEIGHRPKRWSEYKERRQMTKEEMESLCRHEESRADIFAGKALAEMELSCEPLAEFLLAVQDQPHPEYFDADVRAQLIRDAHAGRVYRSDNRKKLFPEFDRNKSPKGHLGEY